MVERQSAADAFTGFLTPSPWTQNAVQPVAPPASPPAPPPAVGLKARAVLATLADGKPRGVEALRKQSGLSFLEFAAIVGELRDAGLVEVGARAGRETLALTATGAALLKE